MCRYAMAVRMGYICGQTEERRTDKEMVDPDMPEDLQFQIMRYEGLVHDSGCRLGSLL